LGSSGREIPAPDMMIAGDDNSRGLFIKKKTKLFFWGEKIYDVWEELPIKSRVGFFLFHFKFEKMNS
jgi:hypothetical protein